MSLVDSDEVAKLEEEMEIIPFNSFEITMSGDYIQGKAIASLFENAKEGEFVNADAIKDDFTDESYRNVTHQLSRNERYQIDIFQVIEEYQATYCLLLANEQRVSLVGAQGLSYLIQTKKGDLPVNCLVVSLDQEENLGFIDGKHRTPCAMIHEDGKYDIYLNAHNKVLNKEYKVHIVCFHKIEN